MNNRLVRFTSDEILMEEVKDILLKFFMKKREGDVNMKAAQMLAIEMLEEAWKELHVYRKPESVQKNGQIGL